MSRTDDPREPLCGLAIPKLGGFCGLKANHTGLCGRQNPDGTFSYPDAGWPTREAVAPGGSGDSEPAEGVSQNPRRSWVIDVCRTCDRLAQWPFCEHKGSGMEPWFEPVTVYGRRGR